VDQDSGYALATLCHRRMSMSVSRVADDTFCSLLELPLSEKTNDIKRMLLQYCCYLLEYKVCYINWLAV